MSSIFYSSISTRILTSFAIAVNDYLSQIRNTMNDSEYPLKGAEDE